MVARAHGRASGARLYVPTVPYVWFAAAARITAKAATVGSLLWLQARLQRRNPFFLQSRFFRECGIGQWATRHTLQALENAGLIQIRRLPGRSLKVTLLEFRVDSDEDPSPALVD